MGKSGAESQIIPGAYHYSDYVPVTLSAGEYFFKIVCNSLDVYEHMAQTTYDEQGNETDTWTPSSYFRFDTVYVDETGATAEFNFPQTAYLQVQLKRDNALPANTIIQAMVTGTYSNPAQCIKEFILNTHWGMGVIASRTMDGVSVDVICPTCYTAAYNFCANFPGGAGANIPLTYNRCIGNRMNARDILTEMCLCGRLLLLDYDGQIHIVPDDDSGSVATIDDDDIIDLSYARSPISQVPNRLICKFADSENDDTVQDIILDDIFSQDDRGQVKDVTMSLLGVVDRGVATQLATFYLNKMVIDESIIIKTNINKSNIRPGDVFTINSVQAQWTNRLLRCMSIEEDENMDITISAQPHYAEIYDTKANTLFTGEQKQIQGVPPASLFVTALPIVYDLVLSAEQYNIGDTVQTDLILTFEVPDNNADHFEIALARGTYGQNNIQEFKVIGQATTGTFRYTVEQPFAAHVFKVVTCFGGRKNTIEESPAVGTAPAPRQSPGYGAGNYGVQWYGY